MEMQFPYQKKLGEHLRFICNHYFNGSLSLMDRLTGIGRDSLRRLIHGEINAPSIIDLLQIYAAIKRSPLGDPDYCFDDLIMFNEWAETELTEDSNPRFSKSDDTKVTSTQKRANLLINCLTHRLSIIRDFDETQLFRLETALANQDYDADIIRQLLSNLNYPFYDCEECKKDHVKCYAESLEDRNDPTIGCFRRWSMAVLENVDPSLRGIEPTSQS